MFLGTAVHRAENGQATWRTAVVVGCAVGSAYWHGDGPYFTRGGWILAFLLAVLTFGAGPAMGSPAGTSWPAVGARRS